MIRRLKSVATLVLLFIVPGSLFQGHAAAADCYKTFINCNAIISETPKVPDIGVSVFAKDFKWAISSSAYRNHPGWVRSPIPAATPNSSDTDLTYSALKYDRRLCITEKDVKMRSEAKATAGGVRKSFDTCGDPQTITLIDYKIIYKGKGGTTKEWTTTVIGDGPIFNHGSCGDKAGEQCNGL